MPDLGDGRELPLPHGMWARRDVCVGYGPPSAVLPSFTNNVYRAGMFSNRRAILVQGARSTPNVPPTPRQQRPSASGLDGGVAQERPTLLWPLRWPRHYADGVVAPFASDYGVQEGHFDEIIRAHEHTHVSKGDRADDRHHNGRPRGNVRSAFGSTNGMRATWHGERVALALEASMDNLFHVLFHALPLSEDMKALSAPLTQLLSRLVDGDSASAGETRGAGSMPLELLPRYTVLWPGDESSSRWMGWELMTRVLSASLPHSLMTSPPSAEHTDALLQPLSLNCYPLVLGGRSPFWPHFDRADELIAVRPRLAGLRNALWRSVRASNGAKAPSRWVPHSAASYQGGGHMGRSESPIVFVSRRSSVVRAISNLEAVEAAIAADPYLGIRVRHVAMESLPLVEQLAATEAARVLVGVHGQGMFWTSMLPTERRGGSHRCGALEIFPNQMLIQRTHAWWDYRRWAIMNGVEYFVLTQPDTPPCVNQDFRRCGNLTVHTPTLAAALRRVLTHVVDSTNEHQEAPSENGRGERRARKDEPQPPLPSPRRVQPSLPLHALDWANGSVRRAWQLPQTEASLQCIGSTSAGAGARQLQECIMFWKGLADR